MNKPEKNSSEVENLNKKVNGKTEENSQIISRNLLLKDTSRQYVSGIESQHWGSEDAASDADGNLTLSSANFESPDSATRANGHKKPIEIVNTNQRLIVQVDSPSV